MDSCHRGWHFKTDKHYAEAMKKRERREACLPSRERSCKRGRRHSPRRETSNKKDDSTDTPKEKTGEKKEMREACRPLMERSRKRGRRHSPRRATSPKKDNTKEAPIKKTGDSAEIFDGISTRRSPKRSEDSQEVKSAEDMRKKRKSSTASDEADRVILPPKKLEKTARDGKAEKDKMLKHPRDVVQTSASSHDAVKQGEKSENLRPCGTDGLKQAQPKAEASSSSRQPRVPAMPEHGSSAADQETRLMILDLDPKEQIPTRRMLERAYCKAVYKNNDPKQEKAITDAFHWLLQKKGGRTTPKEASDDSGDD